MVNSFCTIFYCYCCYYVIIVSDVVSRPNYSEMLLTI